MTHHNHAWFRSAALFMGIFFACLGASAQEAADKTPYGIQSPLPVAALPSAPYKFDLSFKTASIEKVSVSRGVVLATTSLPPGPDGVFRLTLDEAQQAAAGDSGRRDEATTSAAWLGPVRSPSSLPLPLCRPA